MFKTVLVAKILSDAEKHARKKGLRRVQRVAQGAEPGGLPGHERTLAGRGSPRRASGP